MSNSIPYDEMTLSQLEDKKQEIESFIRTRKSKALVDVWELVDGTGIRFACFRKYENAVSNLVARLDEASERIKSAEPGTRQYRSLLKSGDYLIKLIRIDESEVDEVCQD